MQQFFVSKDFAELEYEQATTTGVGIRLGAAARADVGHPLARGLGRCQDYTSPCAMHASARS